MNSTNQYAGDSYVRVSYEKPDKLLKEILDSKTMKVSAAPLFWRSAMDLKFELKTIWILLREESVNPVCFLQQLAAAVSYWDASYANKLKDCVDSRSLEEAGKAGNLWANPPQERTLLIFESMEYLPEGPVRNFIHDLFSHPLENTCILIINPKECSMAQRNLPETERLDKIILYAREKDYRALESELVQQGVRQYSPMVARRYLSAFRHIPDEVFPAFPTLSIFKAQVLCRLGRSIEAHRLLQSIASRLESAPLSDEQRKHLGEVYLIWAFIDINLGISGFTQLLEKADKLLPQGSRLIDRRMGLCIGNNTALVFPGMIKQDIHKILDDMHKAAPYALRLAHGYSHGRTQLASAEVYYYTDQFKKARHHAGIAISQAEEDGQWDIACRAHYFLSRIAQAQADYDLAITHLNCMRNCWSQCDEWDRKILRIHELAQVELNIKLGFNHSVAPQLLPETLSIECSDFLEGSLPVVQAACILEDGKPLKALEIVENALRSYHGESQFMQWLPLIILKAVIYGRMNEPDMAAQDFQLACDMAASNGFIMMFAEYGRHMTALIDQLKHVKGYNLPVPWLDKVQARARTYARNLGRMRKRLQASQPGDSLSRLSRREQEALNLLCEGLSNRDIADRMGIQETSLKTSLRRIYIKIGAESRADAVRLALQEREQQSEKQ